MIGTRVARRTLAATLLVAALPGLGCGDEPEGPDALAVIAQPIIGGEPAVGEQDRAVVALQITRADGERGLCSGLVVGPRAVLTAAHCVAPEAVGQGATFSVFVGNALDDTTASGDATVRVPVTRVTFDPDFDLALIGRGHDVGLAVTATGLAVEPVAIEPTPALDGVDELRIVGFGLSSIASGPTELRAGHRRQATVPLAAIDPLFLTLGAGAAPCLGDSGGPAFVSRSGAPDRLAGLVSFADGSCGPGAVLTNLSSYTGYLRDQLAAIDAEGGGGSCQLGGRGDLSGWACFALLIGARRCWWRSRSWAAGRGRRCKS